MEEPMELLYPCCAALDVHKRRLTACRVHTPEHGPVQQEPRTFGTTTPDLQGLLDWLREGAVPTSRGWT